jgi:hypothetical protein
LSGFDRSTDKILTAEIFSINRNKDFRIAIAEKLMAIFEKRQGSAIPANLSSRQVHFSTSLSQNRT